MAEKNAIVSLEGVMWAGEGLVTGTYNEMVKQKMINENNRFSVSNSKSMLKAIGRGIKGKTPRDMSPLADEVSRQSVARVDDRVASLLKQFTKEEHQLFAMSSAPHFVVEAALGMLEEETEVSFSQEHILSSVYPMENGRYTGQALRLPKKRAVEGLMKDLGVTSIDIGIINGLPDCGWAAFCTVPLPINPGPGLISYLETSKTDPA
jgi:hypothetical protein